MSKWFSLFLIPCAALFGILMQSSKDETHSIFFIKDSNLYDVVQKDGSFGSAPAFFLLENIKAIKDKITTGEYLVVKNETAFSLIRRIIAGNKVIRKITFPEGYTVKMIIEKLNQNDLLKDKIEKLPNEGSLMPDTYFYQFYDSRISIISKMENNMKNFMNSLESKTKLTKNEVLTLASIVEKESGNTEEQKLIASVFYNRLSKNMRLQSDPTVIYAISDGYGKIDRKLTRKDLKLDSNYNTYRKNGLPPTPICCPGKLAIKAVAMPIETKFLYFVADGFDKKHRFSENYKNHLEKVNLRREEAKSKN